MQHSQLKDRWGLSYRSPKLCLVLFQHCSSHCWLTCKTETQTVATRVEATSLPCTYTLIYTLRHTGWNLRYNNKYNKNQDYRQKQRNGGQTDWKNTCIQLPRQAWRPGYDSTEGKNRTECKTKQKKDRQTDSRGDKDIDEQKPVSTESHILSSKQILGPMTLAAPDTRRKAKCFGGQGAESPHLYLRGRVSAKIYDTFVSGNTEDHTDITLSWSYLIERVFFQLTRCWFLTCTWKKKQFSHSQSESLVDIIHRAFIKHASNIKPTLVLSL